VAFVAWTGLFISWGVRLFRRKGFTPYEGGSGKAAAARHLQTLQEGPAAGIGLDVIKCDDNIWRDVVNDALSKSAVAVIDVSELTDNIRWELKQALNHLGEEHIVLAVEDGSTTTDRLAHDLSNGGSSGISVDMTSNQLHRALITYPASAATGNVQSSPLVDQLRREIVRRRTSIARQHAR
jgi:hypothetical protein